MIRFGLRYCCKLFHRGNVSVFGLRGAGKDVLFSNVIARRKLPYISNVDYNCGLSFIPLSFSSFDTHNNFSNFIENNINHYDYPYNDNIDVYVSDLGVILPSQYFSQIERKYGFISQFMALSRHLGNCNFHYNTQNLNRVYDKIREQSDIYLRCIKTRFIGSLVFLTLIEYDKYQSALDRVSPYTKMRVPLFGDKTSKNLVKIHNDEGRISYRNNYGLVRKHTFIFFNKSNFDSRFYKTLLKGGNI